HAHVCVEVPRPAKRGEGGAKRRVRGPARLAAHARGSPVSEEKHFALKEKTASRGPGPAIHARLSHAEWTDDRCGKADRLSARDRIRGRRARRGLRREFPRPCTAEEDPAEG